MSGDNIKGRNDFVGPPTSMPPKGKVWQAAGPIVLGTVGLLVTFAGALLHHVSDDFLQKYIEWTLIGAFASSTPRGVLDAIKTMVER